MPNYTVEITIRFPAVCKNPDEAIKAIALIVHVAPGIWTHAKIIDDATKEVVAMARKGTPQPQNLGLDFPT